MPGAIILIAVLSLIIFYGVKESAWVAILFTFIEIGGIILIIFIGLPYIGEVDYFEMLHGLKGVFEASALVFFAYKGFEGIVKLSEEAKSPERTIPTGLLLTAMESDGFFILSSIALLATANTVLIVLLVTSRITYGMADSYSLPGVLARVHSSRRTPWVAIFALMVLSMLFVLAGDIVFVAKIANFTIFLIFIMIYAAVVLLRHKRPEQARPFRIPLAIGRLPLLPVAGMVFSFMAQKIKPMQ